MFCPKHIPNPLGGYSLGLGSCSQCPNGTNSTFLLCSRCSEGFDQCEVCRAELNSKRDPALTEAFKSDEAAAARKAIVTAAGMRDELLDAERQAFERSCKPFTDILEARLAPEKEKFERETKAFYQQHEIVWIETRDVLNDPNATAGQRLDAQERRSSALGILTAACKPASDRYEVQLELCQQAFVESTAPFHAEFMINREAALAQYEAVRVQAEANLQAILDGSVSPEARILRWVRSIIGRKV